MHFKVAVLGAGRWAQILVKLLQRRGDVEVSAILTKHRNKHRDWAGCIPVYSSLETLFSEHKVDGAVICVPPASHVELCLAALDQGLPCFLEKPAALSSREMSLLYARARAVGVPVVVDYVHLYSTSFQEFQKECRRRAQPRRIIALAGNTEARPRDCSLLWEWGAHDMAMLLSCLGKGHVRVKSAEAWPEYTHSAPSFKMCLTWDDVPVNLRFSERLKRKSRLFIAKFDDEVLIYDGLSPHSFTIWERPSGSVYRKTEQRMAKVGESQNPLGNALEHFIRLARGQGEGGDSLELSLEVTRVLELCDRHARERSA